MKSIFKYKIALVLFLSALVFTSGCKKLIEVDPPKGSIVAESVYSKPSTAAGVLTGIFSAIGSYTFNGGRDICVQTGLSADEISFFNGVNIEDINRPFTNNLSATISPPFFWQILYEYIYRANDAMDGLRTSTRLPEELKNELNGEALFARAFCYFYLVNLYGDVPLVTTTDYTLNAVMPRTPKAQVYAQIITDLKEARNLLSENYLNADAATATEFRLRPNKAAATAMLARAYLYTEDWASAEAEATALIADARFRLQHMDSVFLSSSQEAIWQLEGNDPYMHTSVGNFFILAGTPSEFPYVSPQLFDHFETGDQRKANWMRTTDYDDSSLPSAAPYFFKYKRKWNFERQVYEYYTPLRLAEQYLIRAEARAHLNKLTGANSAASDLNAIRFRAGLPNTTAATQPQLLEAILNERFFELFAEGHRWFDLIRTNKIDQVMKVVTPLKGGGAWRETARLFPIPQSDIDRNPALKGNQNSGY